MRDPLKKSKIENPLVSILMPAFNAEHWIAEAIKSAVSQTWSSKEIIIVDDGSTDKTLQIAKQFQSKSVKVLSQENSGASAARNKALSLAQGDYIQWLDADNILAPDKISRQVDVVRATDLKRVLFSSSWGRFFYRFQKTQLRPNALWTDLTPLEWIYRKFDSNLYMIPEAWLVSRELTDMAGPWDERLSLDDDGEYFSRVMANCELIRFVSEAKSYHRGGNLHSLSSAIIRPEKKLRSQFLSMYLQITFLLSLENSARTRAACLKLLQRWYLFFYPEQAEIMKNVQDLARRLGGTLKEPELQWEYSAIRKIFGWNVSKKLVFWMPAVKLVLRKNFDRLLYTLNQ